MIIDGERSGQTIHRCAEILHSTEKNIKYTTIIDALHYSWGSVFYTIYLTFTY